MAKLRHSVIAGTILVSMCAASGAQGFEFGCLVPERRDGTFFVRGAWEVVDGDTVKIGDFTVNLISIDAPEIAQRCLSDSGLEFDCGSLVKEKLREKLLRGGPIATCLVHFKVKAQDIGEGFCGLFEQDPYLRVECIKEDFGGELARDGYARATAVGEFPTSSLYWAGHDAIEQKRGLFGGQILPLPPSQAQP